MTERRTDPAPLRIIAWLAMAMGTGAALDACHKLAWEWLRDGLPESIRHVKLMSGPFVMNVPLAAVALAAAVIALWAGIHLLRLRAWARTVIEAFCWLYIAFEVLSLGRRLPWWFASHDYSAALHFFGIAADLLTAGIHVIAAVVVLRYLRGPWARAAVTGLDAPVSGSMAERHQACAALRIIAWLAIAVGMGMVGSVGGTLLMPESSLHIGNAPEGPGLMAWLVTAFQSSIRIYSAALMVFAVSGIWAGINLLRLRTWARMALEVLGWLYIGFGIVFVVMRLALTLTIPELAITDQMEPAGMRFLMMVELVDSGVTTVICVIFTVVVLRYLRSAEARAAVAGR